MVKKGTIIRLEYYDQNSAFERAFPAQNCEIIKRFAAEYNDWFLVKLSQPFFFEEIENTQLLIRSRWMDRHIGEREETSVSILLIPNDSFLKKPLDIDWSYQVAWGMAYSV